MYASRHGRIVSCDRDPMSVFLVKYHGKICFVLTFLRFISSIFNSYRVDESPQRG